MTTLPIIGFILLLAGCVILADLLIKSTRKENEAMDFAEKILKKYKNVKKENETLKLHLKNLKELVINQGGTDKKLI